MADNNELMIKIDNVVKQYKLGEIGGTTLRDELQRLGARIRHKEDPTKKIGAKDYNKGEIFRALDGVSFEVKKGERVGIIGHNGAGKSTLLKLISRVTTPTEGSIGLNGRITSMLEVGTGFNGELTGRENIYMNGAILGMTKKEIDDKMEDIIEFSECRQFIDTPVKRYSSGMYVKLAFSVAAHLDSEIMIMDEVLAVGDMAFQKKCLDKMNNVSREQGRTILYVSHNMNTIRQLCDRVVVLDHGKVVFDGGVEEGVATYMAVAAHTVQSYNLDVLPRPYSNYGTDLRMLDFSFEKDTNGVFFEGSPVKFTIKWHSNVEMSNLYFRFGVQFEDGTHAGLTESEKMEAEAKTTYLTAIIFPAENLAAGKYYFTIDFYSRSGAGSWQSFDHISERLYFELITNADDKIAWKHQYFGHVRLNTSTVSTAVLEEKENG